MSDWTRSAELVEMARAKQRALRALVWSGEPKAEALAKDVLTLVELLRSCRVTLAQRLTQLGFTDRCAAHGEDYSETCGGCACAWLVQNYDHHRSSWDEPVAVEAGKQLTGTSP